MRPDNRGIPPPHRTGPAIRQEEPYEEDGPGVIATDVLIHNLERHKPTWTYKFESPPLYSCAESGTNLDSIAGNQLAREAAKLDSAWPSIENVLLAQSGPGPRAVLIRIELPCPCGKHHLATFYADPMLGVGNQPGLSKRCLLADVQNADLQERLDGIASKNEIMDLLEKLIIRWHLTADRTLITVPFVGHPWVKPL
jgi:hypothetical protein